MHRKILLLLIISTSLLNGCSQSVGNRINENEKACTAIRVKFDLPLVLGNGDILDDVNDSIDIFRFDNTTLFQFSLGEEKRFGDSSTMVVKGQEFFLLVDHSDSGYFFDWKNQVKKCPTDSLIQQKAPFFGKDTYLSIRVPMQEIQQQRIGDTLIKKFIPKVDPGIDMPDTIKYYFFEEWRYIPFSLSKTLDDQFNSKAFRYSLIFNSRQYDGYKFRIPKRTVFLEMKPIENGSCRVVEKYLGSINSDNKKIK